MAERAVRIPQLYQARWWLRLIRTLLLLFVVVLVVGSIDRPEAGLLLLLPVLIWAVRTVGRRPVRLDPVTGSLTFPYRRPGWRRASLADDVALIDDGRQRLVLQIGADERNRVPILRWTRQVRRTQRPDVLDALAAALDRHAPQSAPVADRLRAQAAFLAAGGRLIDSPLIGSVRYSDRWNGVGSGLSDLLDTILVPFRW